MKQIKWYVLAVLLFGVFVFVGATLINRWIPDGVQMGDHSAHMGGSQETMIGGNGMNDHGAMGHGPNVNLVASTEPKQPLPIPKRLKPDRETDDAVYYTVRAEEGSTRFLAEGKNGRTLGYNGDLLGPMLELPQGKTVQIDTVNNLDEATSFHWHGLVVPSDVDGGPHQLVEPGETTTVRFDVDQDPATLWFHPHPMGATAKQVYDGLAGLLYVTGNDSVEVPNTYGVDDIPIIVQDRTFNADGELDYRRDGHPDGTLGDTLLANGAINTVFNVTTESLRVRLVNGSQARNFEFALESGEAFTQIASDGGMLEKPVDLKRLALSPGERAEIVIDFSDEKTGGTEVLLANGVPLNTFVLDGRETNTWNAGSVRTEPVALDGKEADRRLTLFGMGEMVTIDGKQYDHNRIDIEVKQGDTEVWEIYNEKDMMGGMTHPFHVHGVQFRILDRDGVPPQDHERGWKDTVAVAPGERVNIQLTFTEVGTFMYHCHILEHEENGMMGQLRVSP